MSDVFFLKYRPQKISELDSSDVRDGLAKLIRSGRIPHALLFSGPRGTGKTSAARIVGKTVNCENRKRDSFEPCNHCHSCLSITDGTALDLIEIDAASNRGIDDIRDLREKVKLSPAQMKTKVYIIDEAHMLTTEAFNALLKTLEEPPENTIFILCTTVPEKLPATIISRCLRFNFQRAKNEEIVNSLQRVVKGEKLQLEKGVLEEIAKSSDGSFRDGQKVLDQLSAGGKKITLEETKKLLGTIEALSSQNLLSLLVDRKTKESLLEINRIVVAGGDLTSYAQDLLEKLRCSLLAKVGLNEFENPAELEILKKTQLQFLLEIFSKAAVQIRTSPIPQLPLELAVVKWCGEETQGSIPKESREVGNVKSQDLELGQPKEIKSEVSQNLPSSPRLNRDGSLEEIKKRWAELLTQIKPQNHSVEALLRACRPINLDGGILTLEVFYRFHKERLEEEKCRRIFEETASEVLSRPIRLKCVLGDKKSNHSPGLTQDFKPRNGDVLKEKKVLSDKELDDSDNGDVMKMAEEIFGSETN